MSAQSHALGEGSRIVDAPSPIIMMPNSAVGSFISASVTAPAAELFARLGAATIQVTEPRAKPASTSAVHANSALIDGSLSMTMACSPRKVQIRAAASPTIKVGHWCGWRAVRVKLLRSRPRSPARCLFPDGRKSSLPGGRAPRNASGAPRALVCPLMGRSGCFVREPPEGARRMPESRGAGVPPWCGLRARRRRVLVSSPGWRPRLALSLRRADVRWRDRRWTGRYGIEAGRLSEGIPLR